MICAKPDIRSFKLDDSHDFIILGCDGIFDKLNDRDCVDCVWNTVNNNENPDIHESLGQGAECIMKNALNRRSLDNVTIVIVAFQGFKQALEELHSSEKSTPNLIPTRGYKPMGPQSVRSSLGGVSSV